MWKPTAKYKPTAQMLFDKVHDVILASDYVGDPDTKQKAQGRLGKLKSTLYV